MPNIYPHDVEAERSLLGAMLISKDVCQEVSGLLYKDDFYLEQHQIIFEGMHILQEKGEGVDYTTLSTYLKNIGKIDKAGGVEYLVELGESVPTIAHSRYYMKIVEEKSILRRLIQQATKVIERASDEVEDVEDFISVTEKEMLEVVRNRNVGEFKDVKSVVESVTEQLVLINSKGGVISGVPCKFRDIDRLTSGFQKGDLIILAARPSVGKTAFALNIATNVAFRNERAVAVFSLEMPAEQLIKRSIAAMGGIDSNELRNGDIISNNIKKYHAAAERVMQCNLYIDDTPGIKINEIISKCRRLKQEQGLELIVIDYLQLIVGNSKNDSRQQEVSNISRQLKGLARELEVPLIALSQLSRSVEKREDKRPMMSDLRESGAIEQDADIVAFLYREDYQNLNSDSSSDTGIIEVNIAKHRNGATARVELAFEKNYSRFSNLDKSGEADVGRKDIRI